MECLLSFKRLSQLLPGEFYKEHSLQSRPIISIEPLIPLNRFKKSLKQLFSKNAFVVDVWSYIVIFYFFPASFVC